MLSLLEFSTLYMSCSKFCIKGHLSSKRVIRQRLSSNSLSAASYHTLQFKITAVLISQAFGKPPFAQRLLAILTSEKGLDTFLMSV
jgi:hypothetical protein